MLTVTDISGKSEPLVDIQNDVLRHRINENYEFSFTALKTDNNYGYDLIQEDSLITVDKEKFVIKNLQEQPNFKSVVAVHEFFDLSDDFVEGAANDGIYSINDALGFIFDSVSGWNYTVDGAFGSALLVDFGNDNVVSLLNRVLVEFGAEYTVSSEGKMLYVKKRAGEETDFQIRNGHNLVTIDKTIDSTEVKTAVKVYYNPDGYGGYLNNLIYESPNINRYRRVKYAPPLYLDEVFTAQEARNRAANGLNDSPVISITTEFTHLIDNGMDLNDIALGNSFYLVDERLGLKESVRIVEIESYPLRKWRSPIVVVSNIRKRFEGLAINQQLQYQALDYAAVKQKNLYNGVTIDKENGVKVVAQNNVEVTMNATEGFKITRDGQQEFYVDTEGNVNFDGRLNITENGQTLLEAYQDNFGGRVILNDIDGRRNILMGSESGTGNNRGGTFIIYDDGSTPSDRRVELGVASSNGSGVINLRDGDGKARVVLQAQNSNSVLVGITDESEEIKTYLTETTGVINNQTIATRDWVNSQGFVTSLPNFLTQQDLNDYDAQIKQYIADNYQPL